MKKKLLAVQMVGMSGALASAYLVLLVPDSTVPFLALSMGLMYATVFLFSFTLATVGGALAGPAPAAPAAWGDILRHGRRGWGRAALVVLMTGGLLYSFYGLGWHHPALWLPVVGLSFLAVPPVAAGFRPAASRLPRALILTALSLAAGFFSWVILTKPMAMSRPWMEVTYLGARVTVAFLLGNLACMLLLAAGASLAPKTNLDAAPGE